MVNKVPHIAIVGRKKDTLNYELAFSNLPVTTQSCLTKGKYHSADALILPGGGDINPFFFRQSNISSTQIDTELDIIQFQALESFVLQRKPILGICKGFQLINLFFGGTIYQNLSSADLHKWIGADQFHSSQIIDNTPFSHIYGDSITINSAHHQGIEHIGYNLKIMQTSFDNIIEGFYHSTLPILGVQWHPERHQLGMPCLIYFVSLVYAQVELKKKEFLLT